MLRIPIQALAMLLVVLFATGSASCGKKSVRARAPVAPARIGGSQTGTASWYGVPYHGRRTASGEVYDMERLTAAHRELPFDTWVAVTNLGNGKSVDVRINDRGPFVRGRIIDLSRAAARNIEMLGSGTAKVRLTVIPTPNSAQAAERSRPSRVDPPRTSTPPPPVEPVDPPEAPLAPSSVIATPAPTISEIAGTANAPTAGRAYSVQVGAFVDRERAEVLRAAMVTAFVDARVVSNGQNPPLWRVLVGREMTLDQATEFAARVRQSTSSALIVPEP